MTVMCLFIYLLIFFSLAFLDCKDRSLPSTPNSDGHQSSDRPSIFRHDKKFDVPPKELLKDAAERMGAIVFQKDIYGGIPNSLYLEMGQLFKTFFFTRHSDWYAVRTRGWFNLFLENFVVVMNPKTADLDQERD